MLKTANQPDMPDMVGRDPAAKAAWAIAVQHQRGAISVKLACDIAEAIRKEVRETLTYLYGEAKEWKEDVDGDCVDGVEKVYVTHHVVIGNGLLDELLDLAGIKRARYDESALQALDRASNEDSNPGLVDAALARGR